MGGAEVCHWYRGGDLLEGHTTGLGRGVLWYIGPCWRTHYIFEVYDYVGGINYRHDFRKDQYRTYESNVEVH